MKKLFLVVFLCSAFLFIGNTASAIPTLGVAPGAPGDTGLDSASFDGFPMPLSGGSLTVWYGSDSGNINYDSSINDIWLLTTSSAAAGGSWTFTPNGGSALSFTLQDLSVASYKDPVYGVNLTDGGFPFSGSWSALDQTFYSYEFGTGQKEYYYLNGQLSAPGVVIGDWMYAVLEGNSVDDFSPKTTSSQAVPEPTTMALLGFGLVGLAGFGRKRFKK